MAEVTPDDIFRPDPIEEIFGPDPIEEANRRGLTLSRFYEELEAQLGASETKVKFLPTANKRGGNWQYSKPLKAWGVRQKATEMLGRIHGVFVDRVDLTSKGKPIGVQLITNVDDDE